MAMKKKNPFPGMNPWFEKSWPGVHSLLISCITMKLASSLPEDLVARPEEGVSISAEDCDGPESFRADVAIREAWKNGDSPAWRPEDAALAARAAVPTIVRVAPMKERWVEIRDSTGTLVTLIEILSPANKCGRGLTDYQYKRRALFEAAINLVEIDLLLGGEPIFPEALEDLPEIRGAHYFINIKRAGAEDLREIHRPLLREPLPVIAIPLRKGEKDIYIDLQPLIDQVYEAGRYGTLDYSKLPDVPLEDSDRKWLIERVAES